MEIQGHFRITLLGRTAEKKSVRLVRYHAPEGSDVGGAVKVLQDVLSKLGEGKLAAVTRVVMERVDSTGKAV